MPLHAPAPYPADIPPEEAATRASEALATLKGNPRAALEAGLAAFGRGSHMEAIETIQPMLRYNPGTAGCTTITRLYHRWVHALPIDGLEPLVEGWWDYAQTAIPAYVEDVPPPRIGALACIRGLVEAYSSILEGRAPDKDPETQWHKVMTRLGSAGYRVLPPRLWPTARNIARHIAKARLRNPNIAPYWCHGDGKQAGAGGKASELAPWQLKLE